MDEKLTMIAIFLLVICLGNTSAKTYDKLEVKMGTHECVSDCTHQASGNENVTVDCSVHECTNIPTSFANPQPPEIEEVFIEQYTDESERKNKLALHIKWSPVDNVSLEWGTGFMLNITDGTYSYSRCYNITSSQDFHHNKHDIFNNDCFGKVKDTYIKPGSLITVHITGLPIDPGDPKNGLTTAQIQVPDCSNEQLFFLEECEPEGGRPTNEACSSTDCSTSSIVNNVSYHVSCDISVPSFGNIGGPERCVEVNKNVSGTPAPPQHVKEPQQQEWYKFIDPETGEVKVALNFTWMPSPDSSFEHTHSYSLEIKALTGAHDLTNFNKCFSIHTVLKEEKHKNAKFFYDCYGRVSGSTVSPDHKYLVHLNSNPSNGLSTKFEIKIPNCVDPRMQDVTHCINDNSKYLNAEVESVNCDNRSIVYKYNVSSQYGRYADILFCELGSDLAPCKNSLKTMENLALSNTLYNISLASSANLSIKYVVLLHGSDYPQQRLSRHPDFSVCVKPTPNEESTIFLIIILIVGIIIVIALMFLVCFCFRQCDIDLLKKLGFVKRDANTAAQPDGRPVVQYSHPVAVPMAEPLPPPPEPTAIIPGNIRVYVIFADDHDLHKEVVYLFCCYLKQDLGLDVRVVLWQESEAASNSISYMITNLNLADKVIVICSEGSKDCLKADEYNGDMFTPAVKKICQEAFIGRNPGKYLVAYFDYSMPEHIPELLRDQCMMYFSIFKLMKQFEQFYFRLVGLEQYQEGGIQRVEKIAFDRYDDPLLTSCGKPLKEKINLMSEFVRNNPTWYKDRHGVEMAGSQLPPLPVAAPSTAEGEPRELHQVENEGLASINHMHLSHPPEIPNGNVSGARRKMMNAAPQPFQNHQEPPPLRQQPPVMEIPVQNTGRSNYQHLSSVTTSEGTDDNSYLVPETETEDLSVSPPVFRNDANEHEDFFPNNKFQPQDPLAPTGSINYNRSFHAESFRSSDFPTAESEDSLLTDLSSNETQITRIGIADAPELPMINEEDHLISYDPISIDIDEGYRQPESGVFTLANIDDDDEDIEDQIESINQSTTFA